MKRLFFNLSVIVDVDDDTSSKLRDGDDVTFARVEKILAEQLGAYGVIIEDVDDKIADIVERIDENRKNSPVGTSVPEPPADSGLPR